MCVFRNKEGQTQTDWPQDEDEANFNHFVDLHFGARGIQGWPQIMIQVYLVDSNGRRVLYGYGSSILPITAGYEEIEIGTWRPADQSIRGRLKSYLLDSSPELAEPENIISSATQQRHESYEKTSTDTFQTTTSCRSHGLRESKAVHRSAKLQEVRH